MEQALAPMITLSVYAFEVSKPDEVLFSIKEDGALPNGYKLMGTTLRCKKDSPIAIRFKLKDRTGLDLEFSASPFSASAGEDCPPTGPDAPAFGKPEVKGKTLQVPFSAAGDVYSYVLRFDTGDGGTIEFDPIIINRR